MMRPKPTRPHAYGQPAAQTLRTSGEARLRSASAAAEASDRAPDQPCHPPGHQCHHYHHRDSVAMESASPPRHPDRATSCPPLLRCFACLVCTGCCALLGAIAATAALVPFPTARLRNVERAILAPSAPPAPGRSPHELLRLLAKRDPQHLREDVPEWFSDDALDPATVLEGLLGVVAELSHLANRTTEQSVEHPYL